MLGRKRTTQPSRRLLKLHLSPLLSEIRLLCAVQALPKIPLELGKLLVEARWLQQTSYHLLVASAYNALAVLANRGRKLHQHEHRGYGQRQAVLNSVLARSLCSHQRVFSSTLPVSFDFWKMRCSDSPGLRIEPCEACRPHNVVNSMQNRDCFLDQAKWRVAVIEPFSPDA
jgi:hypothetical protein